MDKGKRRAHVAKSKSHVCAFDLSLCGVLTRVLNKVRYFSAADRREEIHRPQTTTHKMGVKRDFKTDGCSL